MWKYSLPFLVLIAAAVGRRIATVEQVQLVQDVLSEASNSPSGMSPNYAFWKFFEAKGLDKKQTAALQAHFIKSSREESPDKKWPMRNKVEELRQSCKNPQNDLRGGIEKVIADTTGKKLQDLSKEEADTVENVLSKKPSTNTSALLQVRSREVTTVAGLSSQMSVLSGHVANNALSIAQLGSLIAANSETLLLLTGTIGEMANVAAPTVALASSLGVSTGAVASLALAGSFVGPLVGVLALIYVSWPQEEIDPWFKIEARVAKMINSTFEQHRRTRLGNRLRRYIRQYAQCAKAWVASSMSSGSGVSLPKWIVDDAESAKKAGNFNFTVDGVVPKVQHEARYPSPPCMEELETHMSLERDEWFQTDKGQVGGLFMPFANMHTQMLSMLTDHPYDDNMQWGRAHQSTAAEYGTFMLSHMLDAWKAQMCRTVRLRQSMSGMSQLSYQWVVLKPQYQPNAGEECSKKCGGKLGWCDFCGGKNVGACCDRQSNTSDPVCAKLDAAVQGGWFSSGAPVCVHNDCIQNATEYVGNDACPVLEGEGIEAEECQQHCQEHSEAKKFSLSADQKKCRCLKQDGLRRQMSLQPVGNVFAQSGPTVCGAPDDSIEHREEELEDQLDEEAPNVPMDMLEPCTTQKADGTTTGKSQPAPNFKDVEEKQEEWMKKCYTDVVKVVTVEFNRFYKRFGKFVDSMAWQAGCGAQREVQWEQGGWIAVSDEFDAGSFNECNWDGPNSEEDWYNTNAKSWIEDMEKARGWLGKSKIVMETQKESTFPFPSPSWLSDLRRQLQCLKNTAAGQVADRTDGRSTAVGEMMGPVTMTNEDMDRDQLTV